MFYTFPETSSTTLFIYLSVFLENFGADNDKLVNALLGRGLSTFSRPVYNESDTLKVSLGLALINIDGVVGVKVLRALLHYAFF